MAKLVSATADPLGFVLSLSREASQLRMVLDRNFKKFQNCLQISFLNIYFSILYVVCSLNGAGKHLATLFC
jgi:hypothetical protein